MERLFRLHIERLPEGQFLATSEDIQGLVAQGRTINETIEIARDVATKLLEAQAMPAGGSVVGDSFEFPLLVAVES
jgi:predicted RNase H-like HicB family nuclease